MTKAKVPLLVKIAELLLACFVGFVVAEITPPFTTQPSLIKIMVVSGIIVVLVTAIFALHIRKPWARIYAAVLLCLCALLSIVGIIIGLRRYPGIMTTSLKGAPIFGYILWGSIFFVGLGLFISKRVRTYFQATA